MGAGVVFLPDFKFHDFGFGSFPSSDFKIPLPSLNSDRFPSSIEHFPLSPGVGIVSPVNRRED
jgi:hypothetical protein